MKEMELVARNIHLLREVHNYTQEYVADNLGISQNAYSMMETGETRLTIDRLGKLAELYKMDVTDILKLNEQTIIQNVTNNHGSCSHSGEVTIHYALPDEERQFYQRSIERLEKEIGRLHNLVEAISQKLSA